MYWILILFVSLINHHNCVEVHFEAADNGFFLKHSRQPPVMPEISNIQPSATPPLRTKIYDSILSIDRFTIVQTTQPVSIRASYGPFSTKQTVPARYIVPDTIENRREYLNNTTAALIELQQSNMHLDISAHLVRASVPQDSPVLRVLFHAGADQGGHLQRQKICVLLHVSMANRIPLKGRCMPEGEDGVCVAEVVIPLNWWPPLSLPTRNNYVDTPMKVPQRFVQVSYSVFEPPLRNPEQCEPKVQIQPLTTFAEVPLVVASTAFKEVRADDFLTVLIPQNSLYPMSKIHVPVFLHHSSDFPILAFTMKARVKSGVKLLSATVSSEFWNISIEKENPKHTTARVTAFKKEPDVNADHRNSSDLTNNKKIHPEVFSWLLEVADDMKETLESGKIVWSVTYVFDNSKVKDTSSETLTTDETKRRLIAKLQVNKDDIQAVLPMAKNWELMNTAVLTGRQVAQAMKVFIVSQAGRVADVTLQTSCHAEDESVIKVSSSCSSVYVDGSEIRGSSNASVIVKYGTYIGLAKFTVWMPEFPLEVHISDFRLSQIKGWKIVDESQYIHNKQIRRRKKRSYIWGQHSTNFYNNVGADKMTCKARYQQSPVEVYAKFLAIDQNSGRISYFISRRTGLRVTDLVQPLLRVADPKIATLKGRILQGKSMGRTDVQVLSPITGRVIGAKEIRVGSDKVSLSRLVVHVVSGLQLSIIPDNSIENGYIADTSVTHKLTAQYQEGLLDIDLEFSDGSKTPLRDISVEDYFLLVESLDTEVVAFAPMLASHHPRVIAVGEGNGNLLRVSLLLSEDCRTRRNSLSAKHAKSNISPLASALASVEVDFNNIENTNKQEPVQNDGIGGRDRKAFNSNGDLADIIVGIPLKDSNHHEPTVQARQHRGNIYSLNKLNSNRKAVHANMTSMEVGMYILLTAFCFAIIIFVISCVVYASKFRPISFETGLNRLEASNGNFNSNILLRDSRIKKESTTNVHDWVWLGRSTMDRASIHESAVENNPESRIRITSNPILSCGNYNKANKSVTSFNRDESCQSDFNLCLANKRDLTTVNDNDYRPPVPPHRSMGVRAVPGNTNQNFNAPTKKLPNPGQLKGSQQHNQNETICPGRIQTSEGVRPMSELNLSQSEPQSILSLNKVINGICQPSSKQVLSSDEIGMLDDTHSKIYKEMHNAERLVENTDHQQKNAFQFDSLTPENILSRLETSSLSGNDCSQLKCGISRKIGSNEQEQFVVSHPEAVNLRRSKVKRATVVGNPMFSTTTDNNTGPSENLGLDDLDMNYEQIMHYFDNLKESNA